MPLRERRNQECIHGVPALRLEESVVSYFLAVAYFASLKADDHHRGHDLEEGSVFHPSPLSPAAASAAFTSAVVAAGFVSSSFLFWFLRCLGVIKSYVALVAPHSNTIIALLLIIFLFPE